MAYVGLLVGAALFFEIGQDLDTGLSEVLESFPGFLRAFWLAGFWVTLAWTVTQVVAVVVKRRWLLAVECIAAALLAFAIAVVAAAIVNGEPDDVVRRFLDLNGPTVFPPAAVGIVAAVAATMAPYITRPFRRFGRALMVLLVLGVVFLEVASLAGTVAALASGLLAGTAMHLVLGSPGGLPTVSRVVAALADLGVQVHDLVPIAVRSEGIALMSGADAKGEIEVRVYGRDAWDGELMADLWRLAWYRGRRRTLRLSRSEYVEHEGFMTLLAERAGVCVPDVVTAGLADNGDALIAVRPNGIRLTPQDTDLEPAQVDSLWADLARLHAAGIVHHRIDLDRVVRRDGTAAFIDLSSASVAERADDELSDRAQLLALDDLDFGPRRRRPEGAARARVGGARRRAPVLPGGRAPALAALGLASTPHRRRQGSSPAGRRWWVPRNPSS